MFEFKGTAAADSSRERDWRVADHYNIQRLGTRPFTTMLLPTLHQRSLTEDIKRPSLLQLRSRSNSSVASQTLYEGAKLSPSASIDRSTPRSSVDRRSFSGGSTHTRAGSSESFGKTLMARGTRLLRRQNSKHDLTSLQTLDWLEDTSGKGHLQDLSQRRGSRYSRMQSVGDVVSPRYNISEPFNFQHLTHTTPQHVEKIQKKSHNDLVTEFSAIRASQAPRRELRGIKATNIQQGMYFSESSASETSSPPRTGYSDLLPESPQRDQGRLENCLYNPSSPVRQMSRSKSIENFSQPSPSYHTAQTSPTSPPPRTSSRHLAPDFFTFHQESPTDTTFDPLVAIDDTEPLNYPIATWNNGVYDFSAPHAVTTPDDTAHSILPPPFTMVRTELAGVPEEDETPEGKRSSIATSIIRPTTPTSSIRHAKSFPSTKSSPLRRSGSLPQTIDDDEEWLPRQSIKSVGFEAPCIEEHRDEVPARPRVSRRISMRKEESWEDVIDYCYEHEAEADCNFEWDCISTHEEQSCVLMKSADDLANGAKTSLEVATREVENAIVSSSHNMRAPRRSSSYSTSPPLLLPLQTHLPELEPPSANSVESSYSSIPEAVTPPPLDSAVPNRLPTSATKDWSAPATTSPLFMPDDSGSQSLYDDLYHEMIASQAASEQHLPFNTGRVDGSTISNSPRSSRSPISKSSSQESFWYSQAGAAARRHRNTGSVGSLPELIQSKSSDENFDPTGDQLSDSMALLSASNAPADASQRRRSPSLAKDVALKSILSKVMIPEEREVLELPLPLHPAFRDRANSDATSSSSDFSVPPPPPQPTFARRMRSTSSASSLSSRKANRASYSLFPKPPVA